MGQQNAAFIVSPLRSAVGKAFRGSLRAKRPDDLCADLIKAVLAATTSAHFDPALIEDVIVGCAMPEAEQGMNVARFALLLAGLPNSVPGVTINRFCASGVQAIAFAAERIRSGDADCILAGGTESMTLVPMMGHKVVGSRTIMDSHPDFYLGMGSTAENVAREFKVSREDQDLFSYESHMKAVQAIEKGWFKDEIAPVPVTFRTANPSAKGKDDLAGQVRVEQSIFSQDEGPRPDSTLAALAKLKPAFLQGPGASVTAGNSSQMSDGAAMCLVCSESFVAKHGLKPMGRFAGFSVAGVDPKIMGIGPIEAIPKALKKAGISLSQVDRIELNEAFASQALAVIRTCGINPAIVNPTGGAIAMGHPLGATGGKLTATLLHGMKRDHQKYGIVTMCIGTGMGAAAVFEKI